MGRGIKRIAPEGFKWCPGCQEFIAVQKFTPNKSKKDGLHSYCMGCHNARNRAIYAASPQFYIDRQYHYNYGIDGATYRSLLEKQNGSCAVCGRVETRMHKGKIMSLAVDHCHKNGKVRGLLCRECNLALGLLEDDQERIQALLRYLAQEGK